MKEKLIVEKTFLIDDPYEVFEIQHINLEDPNDHDKQNGFHHEEDKNWEDLIPEYLDIPVKINLERV